MTKQSHADYDAGPISTATDVNDSEVVVVASVRFVVREIDHVIERFVVSADRVRTMRPLSIAGVIANVRERIDIDDLDLGWPKYE